MGLIYLDACIVIYLIEDRARRGGQIAEEMARRGEARFGVSPLVKCECLVAPLKRADLVLERAYRELFEVLAPLEMPEDVYLQAARLRALFALGMPDALHLACAQHHRCDELWTNDERLTAAAHGLARNILRTEAPG